MTVGDPSRQLARVETSGVALSILAKEWESEFFGRRFASLVWDGGSAQLGVGDATAQTLVELCSMADGASVAVLECHLNVADFAMAALLENVGFRLVDSRMRFLSKWSAGSDEGTATQGRIVDATPEHRDRILELTHANFTNNDRFVSRFKNSDYFTSDETRRYFEAWIDNTAFSEDSATAVYEVEGQVVGYYIYLRTGSHDGLPVIKGILTAVAPEHRGANAQIAMQEHLYRRLGLDEWMIDNTTQLTNIAVIRNHVRSGKSVADVSLTFYRKTGG